MLDTLSSVKSRLGITSSGYDAFLAQQISLISEVIEAYCRRKFLTANYIQTFYKGDHYPSGTLTLFYYPVSAVAVINEDAVEVEADDFRIHKPSGTLIRKAGTFFYSDETVVEYTAGEATAPLPVLAVLDSLVQERYNKKISGVDLNFGSDVQRISIPGAISIDFDYTLTNNERKSAFGSILGSNANILDMYRSERAIIGSGQLEYVEVDV